MPACALNRTLLELKRDTYWWQSPSAPISQSNLIGIETRNPDNSQRHLPSQSNLIGIETWLGGLGCHEQDALNRTLLELKHSINQNTTPGKGSQSNLIGIETRNSPGGDGIHQSLNRTLLELKHEIARQLFVRTSSQSNLIGIETPECLCSITEPLDSQSNLIGIETFLSRL